MNGVTLLRCICDDTRFEILELLGKRGEMCVGDLVSAVRKGQPLVSHHLGTLRRCGIVRSRADGKRMLYAISSRELRDLIRGVTAAGRKIPVLCDGAGCC